MRKFNIIFGFVFLSMLCGCNSSQKSTEQPNIVFILVDDLGYSDVGYMGHKEGLNTPNIDKLAKSGRVFTQAYAAAPVCSPTRASILTGKKPIAHFFITFGKTWERSIT